MPKFLGLALAPLVAALLVALPAGQAVASHVACGDVITQDTTLDSDLVDCPGDGIVIGADDISLDLNGHTVDGDSRGDRACASGVLNGRFDRCTRPIQPGHKGVTVKGGTVSEFVYGIQAQAAPGNALQRLRVQDSASAGLFLGGSPNMLIEDNVVGPGPGSPRTGEGILLAGCDASTVRGNVVSGNGGVGIELEGSDFDRIERNVVAHNAGHGILVSAGSDNALVKRNRVIGNGGEGMDVSDGVHGNEIEANRISDNAAGGIWLGEGANENRIRGNVVIRNAIQRAPGLFAGGIVVTESDASQILGNRVLANGGGGGIVLNEDASENIVGLNEVAGNTADGILLDSPYPFDPVETWPRVKDNLIEGNRSVRNGADGISVDSGAAGNVLRRNRANANGDDGIDVDSPFTAIDHDIANRNRDLGIEAMSGVTDVGGNRARHNGNPVQCLNVACR